MQLRLKIPWILLMLSPAVAVAQGVSVSGSGVSIGQSSGSSGVLSINGVMGAFTFTGSGVNCASSTTCTFTGTSVTFAGDLSGSTSSQTVVGIQTKAIPSLSAGYLNYSGSAFTFTTPITSIIGPTSTINGVATFTGAGLSQSGNTFTFNGGGAGTTPNMVVSTTNYTFPSSNIWVRMNISSNATVTLPTSACSTLAGWNGLVELSSTSTGTLTIAPNGNSYDGITTQLQPGQSTFIQTDGSTCHSTLPWSSLPVAANVVTAAAPANSSNRIWQSAGANKTAVANDFPEPYIIPAANTNGGTGSYVAGSGWSLPTSGFPTLATRAGSNIIAGVLQFAASNTAQFQIRLPFDYDSTGTVNAVIAFSQGSNTTSGQTIIMQMATGCGATDDPSFNTVQAFSTVTTVATARTMFYPTLTAVTTTGCSAGQMMNVKILRSGSDTASTPPDVYSATITIPRTPVVQPN